MKPVFLSVTAIALMMGSAALAAEQTVRINVGKLTCSSCSYIVATAMKSVESVEIIDFVEDTDFQEGLYTVRFDDELTSAESILEDVSDNGYPATVVEDPAS